jgi:hypothetical protein
MVRNSDFNVSRIVWFDNFGQNGNNGQVWHPATIEQVNKIVTEYLLCCDPEQVSAFRRCAVPPHRAEIVCYGRMEEVVVVARKGDEVIYWEDVEEGFNVSPIAPDGRVLEHWCNQDDLGLALNSWIAGGTGPARLGPAAPIS